MTREEAKLHGFSKDDRELEYSGNYNHLDNVIDEIYDDFESREKELQSNIESARVRIMSNIALTNDFDKKKAYKIINDMFKRIRLENETEAV